MPEESKWGFIINPAAGNGFGKTIIPLIEEKIKEFNVNAEIFITNAKGNAAEISGSLPSKGFTHVVAVGGDGTMNEVAGPLVGIENITLGIVPAGTGNDFIQILGFPDRFEKEHWEILFRKETILMDVGSCNGMYFFNGMGLGFDARVAAANYVEPGKVKKGGGKNKYLWHIIKTLLFFREYKVTITTEETEEIDDCFINTIANGRRFAGGFFLTPKAIANDGLLDICMIRKLNLFQRFRILTMVPKGTHIQDKRINYYQTPRFSSDFGKEVPFHLDGELFYGSAFNVRIIRSGLNIIYNSDGNHYFGTP